MASGTRKLKRSSSGKVSGPVAQVQQSRPFGRLTPRRGQPVALEQVRPVIRIAHRHDNHLVIGERIIFDHELVLFLAGQGIFCFGSDKRRFGPHDLFCVPPFVPHSVVADGLCEVIAVHFDWAPGVPATSRLPERSPYEVRLPGGRRLPLQTQLLAGDRVEADLLQLVAAWQTKEPLRAVEATGCLLRVLAAILRQKSSTDASVESARDRARMEQVLKLLRDVSGPTQPPEVLAQAAGLSVSHFNRLFRAWSGFTPMEYQRRQRIARARALLGDARLSIKEIAVQCGFDDPYHFSRVFRQLDGLSPSQYREAVLASRSR